MAAMGLGSPRSLKYASLGVLCLQNSTLAILMRLSRVGDAPRFNPATAVFVGEALKLATAVLVLLRNVAAVAEPERSKVADKTLRNVLDRRELLRVSVPALLYVVQNNLQYVAISNLDAATFQVSYQLKILTTALFSVLLLRKPVLPVQWAAILALMAGVALVQLDDVQPAANGTAHGQQSMTTGLLAVVAACVSSGFAGVYFEKILKASGSTTSLWERNVQMCLASILLAGGGLLCNDMDFLRARGFFFGYRAVVWAAIFTSAFGGLLTAVVVKYADNILKAFATSIAIVLSVVMSVFIFDKVPTGQFVLGAALVNASVYVYGRAPDWQQQTDAKEGQSVLPRTAGEAVAAVKSVATKKKKKKQNTA